MKQIFSFVFLFISLTLSAQKTVRDANAVTRSVKGFHAIEVSGGVDLYLSQGGEEAVAVSASSTEYRDRIKTEVVNGTLKIYYDSEKGWNSGFTNRKMKAYVSVKDLDKLNAHGGSDVFVDDVLSVSSFSLHISGGSDFKGKLNASVLEMNSSGGSDIYISGKADDAKISCSGGSDVHAYDLITNTCNVDCSGGSDVKITANKTINANASGGSDVYYKGTASSNSTKSGGGSVKKM